MSVKLSPMIRPPLSRIPSKPPPRKQHLGSANQGVRVAIDETGLIGVAYTILGIPGAGSPPPEEVDMVFDRPFLFIVESADGIPMFTGIVNNP